MDCKKPIYMDFNGTTPLDPQVLEAMMPFLKEDFGNPSSGHYYGEKPKKAVEAARVRVANLLKCQPKEIIFTSGGTESNNHAIQGAAFALRDRGNHIITSEFEHPAVLDVCRSLEDFGFETTYLPVSSEGLVDTADLKKAIRPQTILISIMHANNEVGTIQPIKEIAEIARKHDIIIHTDAAQSIGKIPVEISELGVDLLSLAGHKLYAPKGVGALYINKNLKLRKFCHGAGQESGLRAGTENVIEISGLGKACELAKDNQESANAKIKSLRDLLFDKISLAISDIKINGHLEKRLPNTLNLSFKNIDANILLAEIGNEVAASAGAACHSGTVSCSHVLKAMHIPMEWARGSVRFSLGRSTTAEEIDIAAHAVINAFQKLRSHTYR